MIRPNLACALPQTEGAPGQPWLLKAASKDAVMDRPQRPERVFPRHIPVPGGDEVPPAMRVAPVNPPIMPGWHDFDVPAYVRHAFDVPVLVDNDDNIMALGERHTYWPNHDNLLFIKAATGIGAGNLSNGQLQRGAMGRPRPR